MLLCAPVQGRHVLSPVALVVLLSSRVCMASPPLRSTSPVVSITGGVESFRFNV
jgi:hypothetical protein